MKPDAQPDRTEEKRRFWPALGRHIRNMWDLSRRLIQKTYIKKTDKPLARVFKRSLFIASALSIPTTARKVLVYVGTYFIFHPLTLLMFPTAASVLRQQGLDPKLASELAEGNSVHIRRDNTIGKLHALFDHTMLAWPVTAPQVLSNKDLQGYAIKRRTMGADFGVRAIFMKSVQEDPYNASGLTAEQKYNLTLLHEIRHCSNSNGSLTTTLESETDADAAAIASLTRTFGTAAYRNGLIFIRSDNKYDETHGDALYFDAIRAGWLPPSFAEIARANKAASPYIDSYRNLMQAINDKNTSMEECRTMEQLYHAVKGLVTDPLTLRRIDLYEEAISQQIKHNISVNSSRQQPKPPAGN